MLRYAFWNNKGGTGKTSLAFQTICFFARRFPDKRILVVDVCPQANLSELFLGGLVKKGGQQLLMRQAVAPRATIGGYFQMRLASPFSKPSFSFADFITAPYRVNGNIPKNIRIICGDPLLELQSNSMATLANANIAGVNTWISIMDWLKDFLDDSEDEFDYVFMDLNPSFSIYTQIAIANVDRLILPTMADDSSRRAIQNAFSLIFGLRLPSPIYSEHNFASRIISAKRSLPKVHLIIQNRITQYMGNASAYSAVLSEIRDDVSGLLSSYPQFFTFSDVADGILDTRDFQTTGVVAFARGCPFDQLKTGYIPVLGRRVRVNAEQLQRCSDEIVEIIQTL
ncbi:ParA family protein [Blastochloris sulfoviridis]|uniref:ParA family protein n=1 Tax=Blastochloris sulfoviridis TaxID=50712 RepID=A0A5M6HJJ2_9HYPH|nr:ParA family protein [Blastochloris sulfoviridis]KAA5595925.1 ParA family protein [Blastochloris sulfoviridis]